MALDPSLRPTFEAICSALKMDETVLTIPPTFSRSNPPVSEIHAGCQI